MLTLYLKNIEICCIRTLPFVHEQLLAPFEHSRIHDSSHVLLGK